MQNEQIIPAPGWIAVYRIDEKRVAKQLVAWIKEHNPNFTGWIVSGLVVESGVVVYANSIDGFTTYEYQ